MKVKPLAMVIDPDGGCCVPRVLSIYFQEEYVASCQRLLNLGVPYDMVPHTALELLIRNDIGLGRKLHYRRHPKLSEWIKDKVNTTWIIICDRANIRGKYSHCQIVHRRQVIDNHSRMGQDFDEDGTTRVSMAFEFKVQNRDLVNVLS